MSSALRSEDALTCWFTLFHQAHGQLAREPHVTHTCRTPALDGTEQSWSIPGALPQVPQGLARSKYKQPASLNIQFITVIAGGNYQHKLVRNVKLKTIKLGSHEKIRPGRNNGLQRKWTSARAGTGTASDAITSAR